MSFSDIEAEINGLLIQRSAIDFRIQRLRAQEEQLCTALLYVLSQGGYVCRKSHLTREDNGMVVHLMPPSRFKLENWGRVKHKIEELGLSVNWVNRMNDLDMQQVVHQIIVNFNGKLYPNEIEQIIKEAYKAKEKV